MEFRIADTFTDSLGRLAAGEQKAAKTTAFDLQVNPANPGLSFHKLEKGKDPRFWSVRVSRDIRIIVHRTVESLLLCYVDHHDKAYQWAERRKLEIHPKTGAAQMVVIPEITLNFAFQGVRESTIAYSSRRLFDHLSDEDLLSFGVPFEWIPAVKQADEDGLLALSDQLPAEAAEALLELATGGNPKVPSAVPASANPFEHPDALRRFRTMRDAEELAQALDYPWEKWTVFLHPSQRDLVERTFNGPARVSGSAGTGKTIVALHRAVHLAKEHPDARVLLTTFSEPLAHALHTKLRRLIGNSPRLGERLEVLAMDQMAERLFDHKAGPITLATLEWVKKALVEAASKVEGVRFPLPFLCGEWADVVDAWQLRSWEEYRDVRRLGRKTRLPEAQRQSLWKVFEAVQQRMGVEGLRTRAGLYTELAQQIATRTRPPFDFVVVDEAQDLSIAQLKFLAAMGGGRPDALFFAGDLGQRIFQQPFSWKALGVDIRGRSRTLHVSYRTSHQIRKQADRLLGPEVSDVDGNSEDRRGTVSVFNGPAPQIQVFASPEEESSSVGAWLAERSKDGVLPHEMSLFVRSEAELDRAKAAAKAAGLPWKVLDEHVATAVGHLSICTMHLAKGLEFRAVAVMACDDEVIPLQSRIESVGDESELEEVYNTERQLLYVACTRARDFLMVSSGGEGSEYLDDLKI